MAPSAPAQPAGAPEKQRLRREAAPPGRRVPGSVDSAAALGVVGFAGPVAVGSAGVKGWTEGLWRLGHRECEEETGTLGLRMPGNSCGWDQGSRKLQPLE